MKKSIVMVVLFTCFGVFSQNKVAQKIAELESINTKFHPFSVFTPVKEIPDSKRSKVIDIATFAQLQTQAINAIVANAHETLEVEIPYQETLIVVELYKVDLFNTNFHIDTDQNKNMDYQKGVHYRGIIKDDPNSIVSMNFFNNEMNGIISDSQRSNLVIGKLDKRNNTSEYIIYSDADLKVLSGFNCGVKEEARHESDQEDEASREVLSNRCVTMFFEIDYDLFQANDSNLTTTTNWMTSVFNNIQTLYANDGTTIALRSLFIWTTLDPYQGIGTSSSDYLYKFNEVRPVFDGDVGQLLGIDPGGLGGVAVTINGLCSQNNFSYSDVNFSYSTVPTFSWTVQVITHELGHLLGSRHTHSCSWNGNNTSIDGCGSQAGYNEGSCPIGPIPSTIVKGTIMSYCHLISGVGINFANGFGPQPATAILNAVNSGNCLSMDCINTCINTIAGINITNNSETQATVNWTETGSATSWQVAIMAVSSNFALWTTTTSAPYTFSGLNPNTHYKVRIRPVCGVGLTPTYREIVFATTANWCNGIVITDSGGSSGDYTNMQSYVRTLMPTVVNKKINLTFTAFDLEVDYDYLYLYDGSNTTAPDLSNGGFTGNTLPGSFVSTATDGSLTLHFFSDQGVVAPGFVANVGCENSLNNADWNSNIDFTYYPNPTNGLVTIASKTEITEITVYNIAGQLLYQNKTNTLETQVDLSTFAGGTYFFKLRFNEFQANFKMLKQ